jgi:putative flavoprotein involved in K+ transport
MNELRHRKYRDSECVETIIIGAGQAGLAVGYHLARRGRPFVILEGSERIGDSWRNRWDSLRVFTPARYSGLPGSRFPGPARSFPRKDEVADFVEAYARQFDLPVRTRMQVNGLRREGNRYVVSSGDLRFDASNVVVATGAFRAPRIPAFAGELDSGIVQLHSSEYRNPSQLRTGSVLIVGAGNSGAEIALEASRSGHQTWLSGRDTGEELPFRIGSAPDRLLGPPLWFLFSRVLTTRTWAGRKLRQRVRAMGGHPLARVKPKDVAAAGIARVPRTASVRDGYPVLEDGRVMEASNVIWCTGFRPDFRWIEIPVLDEVGDPVHDRGVVASQPGLYFVGQFFLHTLTSSLIGGVGRDAEYIATHIAARAHQAQRGAQKPPPSPGRAASRPGAPGPSSTRTTSSA